MTISKNNIYIIILIIIILCIYVLYYTDIEPFDIYRPQIDIKSIYYINLEKRKDRKKKFLDNFNQQDQSKITRIKAHYYPEKGAVGCLMSHITALNAALKDDNEEILICEDDLIIPNIEYCNKMLQFLNKNIEDWDVIMLGQNTINSKDTGIETPDKEKIIQIIDSQTTSGYLIKKKYIPKLLNIYENNINNYIKTQEWGNYYTDTSWKQLQQVDKWYSFVPSIGIQDIGYSDIENKPVNYGV
jgi:glycosyl transferase family 25